MSGDLRLRRLAEMATMVQEAQSAKLRKAAEARQALRAQLAALDRTTPEAAGDLPLAQAAYAYEGWAALRRAEIGVQLARRHAEWLSELEAARRAFGRVRVLEKMIATGVHRRPPE